MQALVPSSVLSELLSLSSDPAAVLDTHLRYVAVNDAHARDNELAAEDHVGRPVEEVAPGLAFALARLLREALERGETVRARKLVVEDRVPGRLRTSFVDAAPLRDERGGVTGILVYFRSGASTVRDVTPHEGHTDRLFSLVVELSRARSVQDVVNITLTEALPATGATAGGFSLLEPDGASLRVMGATGYDVSITRAWQLVPLDLPIPATVAVREGRALFLTFDDVRRDFALAATAEAYADQAHVALPLTNDERVLGCLTLNFPDRAPFAPEERERMLAVAESCAQAISNLRLFDAEREARVELDRTAALLDSVFENAPVAFAVFDPKLRFLRLNAAFASLSGRRIRDHLGGSVRDLLPDLPGVAHALALTRQTKRPLTQEEVALPDGRTYLVGYYPVLTPQGALVGVGCVATDTTAMKDAERAARASNDRYRSLVDATGQTVWTNTPDGEMRGEQPGWSRLTGQDRTAYEGYGWAEALHPDDRDLTLRAWRRAVDSKGTFDVRHRLRVVGGEYRLFRARAVPVFDEHGGIREWVGVHVAVTDTLTDG
ncbi:PAS domain-containing protein [Deinococcus pimensis]|uniref:PAS domain-containing protein n=1 Tax=Deinococcus pimensis TaxID=309888 RepID=UPI0004888ECC|nr:PAS domain-containing protein [Deinococcus pimensis]